jgi:anti-sigma B factor antagonist
MSHVEKDEPERMHASIAHRLDGVVVITLTGYLDASTYDVAEKMLEKALDEGRCRIVVNMMKLTYISSAGAGVLLAAISRARSLGGEVVLLKPTAAVADVFALIGMSKFCKFTDTIEQADEVFRALPPQQA